MPGRMSSKATYSISDLARHFALTPRTIRFYEAEKLLSPRREKNKRVYSERDLVRLKLILRGKRLGFSLAEIKTTMQLYDPSQRVGAVEIRAAHHPCPQAGTETEADGYLQHPG